MKHFFIALFLVSVAAQGQMPPPFNEHHGLWQAVTPGGHPLKTDVFQFSTMLNVEIQPGYQTSVLLSQDAKYKNLNPEYCIVEPQSADAIEGGKVTLDWPSKGVGLILTRADQTPAQERKHDFPLGHGSNIDHVMLALWCHYN